MLKWEGEGAANTTHSQKCSWAGSLSSLNGMVGGKGKAGSMECTRQKEFAVRECSPPPPVLGKVWDGSSIIKRRHL